MPSSSARVQARHRARSDAAERTRARRVMTAALAATAGAGAISARIPTSVIVPVMIVVLAGVDIAGAVVAKSWADAPGVGMFVAGLAIYAVLFGLYAQSLKHGELTTVTVGWVVVVTIASMALDQFCYGARFPASKWVVVAIVVVLLGYLLTDDPTRPVACDRTQIGTDTGRISLPAPKGKFGEVPSALGLASSQRSDE